MLRQDFVVFSQKKKEEIENSYFVHSEHRGIKEPWEGFIDTFV